jgi:hypothetical protein
MHASVRAAGGCDGGAAWLADRQNAIGLAPMGVGGGFAAFPVPDRRRCPVTLLFRRAAGVGAL